MSIGFSLLSLTRTSYNAFFFVTLNPWENRKTVDEQYQVIKAKLNLKLMTLPQGTVFAFSPPAIAGVGTSGGFQFVLEDRAGKDPEFLVNNLSKFLAVARKRPEIGSINTTYIPSAPQKFVYVDKEKALKQGVNLKDVYNTLQAFMGGQSLITSISMAALSRYMWQLTRRIARTSTTSDSSTYETTAARWYRCQP
jgi:hydrophobic/amphiphilic exporter-1 (mainly G- bacteria), HAE1 family